MMIPDPLIPVASLRADDDRFAGGFAERKDEGIDVFLLPTVKVATPA